MELKVLLKKFKKSWRVLALFGVLGLLVAGAYLLFRPKPVYKATALLFVTRTAQDPLEDYYTYDGFHAQQVAYHYTDTLVALSREFKADIVKRKSEQLVEVGLQGKNVDDVEFSRLVENISATFGTLAKVGDPQVKLLEVAGMRKVEELLPNVVLVLLAGALAGLGVGVFVTAFKEYMS